MPTATREKKDQTKTTNAPHTRFSDIHSDDLMAITQYVKVEKVSPTGGHNGDGYVNVVDVDSGEKFSMHGRPLIERTRSADRFTSTKRATKTQLAEILTTAWNRPFTVVFTKAKGEKRTLRGRLVEPKPLLGHSMVEDLDKRGSGDSGLRLVDHRTIEELTVDGVKYMLKK